MTTEGTGVRLGDLLTGAGLLKPADLREAMLIAKQQGLPVGRVLIMSAYLTEHQLQAAVRAQSMLKDGLIDQETVIKALALVGAEDLSLDDALKSLKWYQQEDVITNKLGELLVEGDIIDKAELHAALTQCESIGLPLGRVLVITSVLSEQMLAAALNAQVLVRDHKITREQAIQGLKASIERQIPLEQYLAENGLLQLPTSESIRLGELLIETGVVDEPSIMNAVEIGLLNERAIGQVLLELGLVQEPLLNNALAIQKMVIDAKLKKSDAARVLRLTHTKKRSLDDAISEVQPAQPSKPEAPQPLTEPLPLYQFLQLAGLIGPRDIEMAVRQGSKDTQIMGMMLVHADVLPPNLVTIAQQSNELICQGVLNVEQAIMALKTCQANSIGLDEVFDRLNWDKQHLAMVTKYSARKVAELDSTNVADSEFETSGDLGTEPQVVQHQDLPAEHEVHVADDGAHAQDASSGWPASPAPQGAESFAAAPQAEFNASVAEQTAMSGSTWAQTAAAAAPQPPQWTAPDDGYADATASWSTAGAAETPIDSAANHAGTNWGTTVSEPQHESPSWTTPASEVEQPAPAWSNTPAETPQAAWAAPAGEQQQSVAWDSPAADQDPAGSGWAGGAGEAGQSAGWSPPAHDAQSTWNPPAGDQRQSEIGWESPSNAYNQSGVGWQRGAEPQQSFDAHQPDQSQWGAPQQSFEQPAAQSWESQAPSPSWSQPAQEQSGAWAPAAARSQEQPLENQSMPGEAAHQQQQTWDDGTSVDPSGVRPLSQATSSMWTTSGAPSQADPSMGSSFNSQTANEPFPAVPDQQPASAWGQPPTPPQPGLAGAAADQAAQWQNVDALQTIPPGMAAQQLTQRSGWGAPGEFNAPSESIQSPGTTEGDIEELSSDDDKDKPKKRLMDFMPKLGS